MSSHRFIAAISALAVAATMTITAGAASATPRARTAAAPPGYTASRIIGGLSQPGLSAWGIAYDQVTNELLVGDYLTSQVRRLTLAGAYLGDLQNPGDRISGVASALGVDQRDGSSYLAVTGVSQGTPNVRKYNSHGTYLYGLDLPGSTTWLSVDKDGYLWAPTAFLGTQITRYRIDDATKTATPVLTISRAGSGPGELADLTGIATDSDDNVYVADVGNKVVHSFTANGTWRFDIGKGIFPGDIRGIAVDNTTGRIFVANSAIGTIEIFDSSGQHVGTFGGVGSGNGQFVDGARQLTLAPNGRLFAADYGGRRVEEFTTGGVYVADFPAPPMPMDPAGIAQSRGATVDPVSGDILVADAWGQRIQRYSPEGTLLASFGERGSSPPDGMNYPKGIAVDPTTRNVWVANTEGAPYLVGFDKDFTHVVRQIKTPRFINDLEWSNGLLYVLERWPGALLVYDPTTGALVRSWRSPLGHLRGLGVDPASGNVWITSDTKAAAYVLSPAGSIIATIPLAGLAWDVAINGDFAYVANSTGNDVQIFDRSTYAAVGTIGSTGTGLGQLKMPSALAFTPGGDLIVGEAGDGRVQVFSPSPGPPPETIKPVAAFDGGSGVVHGQVVVTGTASDASGIGTVSIRVRDLATGRYFSGILGTWAATGTWNAAIYWGPITSVSWRFTVPVTLPARSYQVQVQVRDRRGNLSVVHSKTVTLG